MSLPHASRASIKARLKNATDFGMCAFLGDRTASMKSPAPLSLRQSITRVVISFPSVLCPTATRRGSIAISSPCLPPRTLRSAMRGFLISPVIPFSPRSARTASAKSSLVEALRVATLAKD